MSWIDVGLYDYRSKRKRKTCEEFEKACEGRVCEGWVKQRGICFVNLDLDG